MCRESGVSTYKLSVDIGVKKRCYCVCARRRLVSLGAEIAERGADTVQLSVCRLPVPSVAAPPHQRGW